MLVSSINVTNSVDSKYNSQSFKAQTKLDKTVLLSSLAAGTAVVSSYASGTNASDVSGFSGKLILDGAGALDPKNPKFDEHSFMGSSPRDYSEASVITSTIFGPIGYLAYSCCKTPAQKNQDGDVQENLNIHNKHKKRHKRRIPS